MTAVLEGHGTSYTCNDQLGCTTDSCTGTGPAPAGCSFALNVDHCLIGGACYKNGDKSVANSCDQCSVASTSSWTLASGCVGTIAGDGTVGFLDGTVGTAKFGQYLAGIAVDKSGTILVADNDNRRVRAITGNVVSAFAGNGGYGLIDGPSTSASFPQLAGIAADGIGGLYVVDNYTSGAKVRRIASGTVTLEVPTLLPLSPSARRSWRSPPRRSSWESAPSIVAHPYQLVAEEFLELAPLPIDEIPPGNDGEPFILCRGVPSGS